jgi:RNA polymerase sigma factor for flagellar operon FliA
MQRQPVSESQRERIEAAVPFVEALARRVASSMPHSIDLGDLTQDGMIGLIDAAHRFDEARGIKFETFAERRVRGAMIDALRRDAWPRGVRRMRRELEAARESLRRELGQEPTLADLAARIGASEATLGRAIVRISTIECTSPLATNDQTDEALLPPVFAPPEPASPERLYQETEVRRRVRAAIAALPPRERKVIDLYYFGEVTMKHIGAEIGVNESRVSQLHARAVQRLRTLLAGADGSPEMQAAVLDFARLAARRQERLGAAPAAAEPAGPAVVVNYPSTSRAARSRSASLNGLVSHRQPLSSRKRSASVPATSPVTKMTRRTSAGECAAMAR